MGKLPTRASSSQNLVCYKQFYGAGPRGANGQRGVLFSVSTSGLISRVRCLSPQAQFWHNKNHYKPHAPVAASQYYATWRSWIARFS